MDVLNPSWRASCSRLSGSRRGVARHTAVDDQLANVQPPYVKIVDGQCAHTPASHSEGANSETPDRERSDGECSDGERSNR
jgi:hypothetical protein